MFLYLPKVYTWQPNQTDLNPVNLGTRIAISTTHASLAETTNNKARLAIMTVLYRPTDSVRERSQLTTFAQSIPELGVEERRSYPALHRWSIDNVEAFWGHLWDFVGVVGDKGEVVLEQRVLPGARWFPEARLNFSENLLARGKPDDIALIALSESRDDICYSYRDLTDQVERLAGYLKHQCNIQPGDRVAAYLGNTAEAIIGMLATSRIGAVWTSASPDFGFEGVYDRFGQVQPKVVIVGNGYGYGGKSHDRAAVVAQLQARLDGAEAWLSVDCLAQGRGLPGCTAWTDVMGQHWGTTEAVRLPFDHPLYILYSSGTTGKPKCIVHSAGGTLLQHAKELMLHGDISSESVFFYFTTTGWMMWNWLASGLFTGATLVLFDGNPTYPDAAMLWQMAARHGVTHFGTSAKFLSACRKLEVAASEQDLHKLRVIFSTGSPLAPEDFDWVYQSVTSDVMLHSISGGTDIVSCFVGGNPWSPVVKGKIQGANLGMDIQAWDDAGQPVIGEKGELVCAQPAPCMPIGFWNDPGSQRYKAAYFERFPGVWAHGDFIEFDTDGQVVIHGRSDTTLNPGGVRIGTAEIYRQVETLTEIQDSLVVGRPVDGDIEVILFVQLAAGQTLTEALTGAVRQRIRANTTPRHVPAEILQVSAIPYTRSGKKVELAVTQILRGEEPKNLTAMANPECLDDYRPHANRQ